MISWFVSGRVLNDILNLPFEPSIEHWPVYAAMDAGRPDNPPIAAICVKIFENEDAWASIRHIIK